MAVKETRVDDDEGRHTTVHRELIELPGGGVVIDTPGIRELQLWDSGGIDEAFADVEALAADCRFNDCTHATEPGCAVNAALASGELTADALRELGQAAARAAGDRDPLGCPAAPGGETEVDAASPRRADAHPPPVSDVERRIQAAIRADATRSREVERIGPFVATFTPGSQNPYLNYAIPEDGGEPTAGDVVALVETFARRGHAPRLEYVPGLAPAVETMLLAAGFVVEGRLALMVSERRPESVGLEGVDVRVALTRDDVRAAATAQNEAYGEPDPPSETWVDGILRSIAAGGVLVLAADAATGRADRWRRVHPAARGCNGVDVGRRARLVSPPRRSRRRWSRCWPRRCSTAASTSSS